TYSVNQGNYYSFPENVKKFVDYCQDTNDKKAFSLRYIGSMVADFHRNLLKGGIFMYPATKDSPKGKLRLMYECNPMAFLQEQAGGKAVNDTQRILAIQPTKLHQRTAVYIGSKKMVDMLSDK
ncbi:MAG TPA: class 1 fructose-bisphosphatase, partial [Chitinophagales bacterium]|nr:class 1 fructose-bisphosphatase [Chitinophagales bacterium]